jgi:hypothetical protein
MKKGRMVCMSRQTMVKVTFQLQSISVAFEQMREYHILSKKKEMALTTLAIGLAG